MKPITKTRQTVKRRPAETTGIGAAIVALLALFGLNLSEDQAAALLVLVGLLPAVVTWFKER
jgi:hypothetical protein